MIKMNSHNLSTKYFYKQSWVHPIHDQTGLTGLGNSFMARTDLTTFHNENQLTQQELMSWDQTFTQFAIKMN